MKAILIKEIQSFFSNPTGYILLVLFASSNALLLWVFKGYGNILYTGFASLDTFFIHSAWIFAFLIPAITMKSFAEEYTQGTIEILKTLPISNLRIVLGKFLGILCFVGIVLLPTCVFVYSVYQLGNPIGNVDLGSIFTSYMGLLLLAATYISIGVFTSILTKNQIASFVLSVAFNCWFYFGFTFLASISYRTGFEWETLGIPFHFDSLSRGILDVSNIGYFISIIILFLSSTKLQLDGKKNLKAYGLVFITFIALQALLSSIHYRIDMTKNHLYSLSKPTKELIQTIDKDLYILVYLTGDLPTDFTKLSKETQYFLTELKAENSHIHYRFVNPKKLASQLIKQGLTPSRLTVEEDEKITESLLFPWAILKYNNKTVKVNLLKNTSYPNKISQIEASIQQLEYAFAQKIQTLTTPKKQKIAIIKGNGELDDIFQYDFLKTLGDTYFLAPFTLDSVTKNPEKTLKQLQDFEVAIISKPTEKFTEAEKFTLDQYTLNGGNLLWMLDMVHTPKDSLLQNGKILAYPRDLNLTDYFFNYGIRVHSHLVRDLYAAKIPLAVGNVGNKTQYDEFLWDYYPILQSKNTHLINQHLGPVKLEFANSIEFLNSNSKKTVLLESSKLNKTTNVPNYISLNSITDSKNVKNYNETPKKIAVLLEGNFTSAYKNRVKPFKNSFTSQGTANKMVVIADGDISSNAIRKGKPLELGLDPWTNISYANKDFLLHTVHYLANNTKLLQLKAKPTRLANLHRPKTRQEKLKWQLVNLLTPLLFILFFGLTSWYLRKQKYKA